MLVRQVHGIENRLTLVNQKMTSIRSTNVDLENDCTLVH